ncbi:uncharacterized protein LOC132715672 [Ruditapes philippinarum]|uniref:uncharacterized protein LOC132715672 n=1 Tax=Ruditapes philippinarum TaxID=129788 RepID=UPI00295ABF0C|nr:uncharacterized protein LOC132715672 [Ruditapes philippinarum]
MVVSRRCIMNQLCYRVSRSKVHILLLLTSACLLLLYKSSFDATNTGSKYSFSLFREQQLPEPTQEDIDYFSRFVNVSFAVEDNFISGELMGGRGYFLCSVTLTNTGVQTVKAKRWHLYGYFMRLMEIDNYPYQLGYHIKSCGLKLFHVGGSLYTI